ncbi:MAG: T9SS type A sorting domain-containing protein, partial [Cyclobacteriaceae bacterium]
GFTAAGSSGAPLFNNFSLVIGSLSGGSSSALLPVNDFYSRFDLMFRDGLQPFLDPESVTDGQLMGEDFARETRNLTKIQNYSISDDAADATNESIVAELFTNDRERIIRGIYLSVLEVNPTDLFTIDIISGDEVIYEQTVFSGDLNSFSENFIRINTAVAVDRNFLVRIRHNRSLNFPVLVSSGSILILDDQEQSNRSVMLAVLASSDTEPQEITADFSLIYPNPSTQNFYLPSDVIPYMNSIRVYNAEGREIKPEITTDYQNRVLVNMSFLQKGMYFIKYQTEMKEFFDRVLLNSD